MKKIYKVIYSQLALQDLADIYKYIRFSLKAPITAEKQLFRIKKMISSLDIFPARYPIIKLEHLSSIKIYKAPIDNYIIFYSIDENLSSVSIIRIFYSGKNIDDILKHTNN